MKQILHFIDGQEVPSVSGETFTNVDPWTREPYAEIALGGAADVDRAVAAARRAFEEGPWPRMGFVERGAILHRLGDLIEQNATELAEADTRDMGKPISATLHLDVPRAAVNYRFFADHARLTANESYPMDTGHVSYTTFQPAGVVAVIAPWNWPLMLATWKTAPALAWGNTVVLKPAEDSPTSASILARLASEAGMPPGVFNVVHGFGPESAGAALTAHPDIDRITFTGETATGRAISHAAADHVVPVSLEMGGKGASIVFDDADLDNAVKWATMAAFTNAGQICLAGSRIYVQRGVYAEFTERFVAAANAMVMGDPQEATTQVGPLASRQQVEKLQSFLDEVKERSLTVATGGEIDGWSMRPTVVLDPPASARIVREEAFGPLVTLHPFDTEDDAVAATNDTPYGLSALVFTENLSRGHRVAGRIRAGNVWVNCFFLRDLRAPMGGFGDSGVGRDGGNFSRDFFTEPQAVVVQV